MDGSTTDTGRFRAVCGSWRLLPRADGIDPVLDTVVGPEGEPMRAALDLSDLPVCRARLDCGMSAARRADAVVTLHADLATRPALGMVWAARTRSDPIRGADGEMIGPLGHLASLALAWSFLRDDVTAERPRQRTLVVVDDAPEAPLASLRVARAEAARVLAVDPAEVWIGWTSWTRIGAAIDTTWRRRRADLMGNPALRLLYDARVAVADTGVRTDGADRSWPVPPRDLPAVLDLLLPLDGPPVLPDWPALEPR